MARKREVGKWEAGDADVFSGWIFDYLFSYPEEVAGCLEKFKKSNNANTQSYLEFVIEKLRSEAKKKLIENGYPADLKELSWEIESDMGYETASAKNVLFAADRLLYFLRKNDAENAALEMFYLLTNAFRVSIFKPIFDEMALQKGRKKDKPRRRLRGPELFIVKCLNDKPSRNIENIYKKLSKFTEIHPWVKTENDVEYQVFIDADGRVCQETTTDSRSILQTTFRDYVKKIKKNRK